MKFKFRAEPKDIFYFSLFGILLLYLVAIGILNMVSLAQEQEFYGWNPIMAFSQEYLTATILFYIIALLGIILSSSSYFWERDEGIGFKSGKKEKGDYSRWAKEDEIKKRLKVVDIGNATIPHGGIPLLVKAKKGKVWVDDGEAHSLIMGSTGSGKTRRLILPLIKILAKKGESMILTDPKGELYEETVPMLTAKGYNIVLLNLRSPEKGNAWNPLTLPYQLFQTGSDKANELLADLSRSLLHDEKTDDPFWQNSASSYFTGLALGLFEDAKEEEINLNSISYMSAVGEEKFGGTNYSKEYFSNKDPAKPTYINAAGTINAPQDTKNSILSVFSEKIKIFATTEHLSEMLSYNDFDMKDIGRKKTAVFIIIQDEKKTYHALATIFLKQCYETLIDVAQENGGKLPTRTNFILDEFANMPPLKDVTTMITAARSRKIRFNLVIQNFAQLNQVYGADDAETIKGNCANFVYLMSKELKALEEISKLCGEKKVKGKGEKEPDKDKPLISISELQRLKEGDTIVIKDRSYPFKTKLPGDWEYNFNEPKATKINYPERQKRKIKLFDVREFVKEKRMNAYPNNNMFNPGFYDPGFAGGMGAPFGADKPNQFLPPNAQALNQEARSTTPLTPGYNPNFFNNRTNAGMFNGDDKFNVDDLIKKIDAKIAELEAEEKGAKGVTPNSEGTNNFEISEFPVPPLVEPEVIESKKPQQLTDDKGEPADNEVVKINPDIDKIINSSPEDGNTDDQFFDDFFSDNE